MSIRLRLALWYTLILGVSLLVFGLGLYFLMARHLNTMAERSIKDRAEHIEVALEIASSSRMPFILPPLDAFESPGVYVVVLDPQGATMGSSTNLEGRSLPLSVQALTEARSGKALTYEGELQGSHLKIYLRPVSTDGRITALVQVATSTAVYEEALDRLLVIVVGGGIGALVLAGLTGWALAGKALEPISDITETARAIALSQGFSRRLEEKGSRDEVGLLSVTFNEMLASLESAYAAQRRFVADASHELRAPLTTIRGNLDLLKRVGQMPPEEQARAIDDARQEVERLSRLVSDLLSIAQADAGQRLDVQPVELDVLVMDVHRQALSMTSDVQISISDLEPIMVSGDRDRLRQLLLIFVDNALRYTPAGGRVSISLSRQGDWAVLGVQDTGIGIEEEDLPHIFDRFYRADRARARDPGGSGLGLSIARWIVEEHGGEIDVWSKPGQGSTFTARLPALPA
ncbi:MAG: ATP-binding protein [Chloroflexi bacterium]|nr:ATP-binding protein [Chloroflexota bacterium]